MRISLVLRISLLCAVVALSQGARAFQVSPMSASLLATGREASMSFELMNKSDRPVPIEVSINKRTQDLDGKDIPETSTAAEEKFVIYPPQFILEPKSTRLVKVTWIGGKEVAAEQAFRVNFQEVSVPTKKGDAAAKPAARISLLVTYSASLYVRPAAKPAPRIVVASAGPSVKDPTKLELILENQGTMHQMLRAFRIKLEAPDHSSTELTERDLPQAFEKNILASSKLRVLFPWPGRLPKGPLKAEFKTQ